MRLAGLALGAVVMMAVGACGSESPSDEPTTDPTTTPLDVTLEADLGAGQPSGTAYPPEAEGLIAEYTVTNNSDAAILVVERRPDVDTVDVGLPLPDTEESTWVYADDDATVRVTKEMFPVAHEGELGEAFTVSAVRVEPGASMSGRAFTLLPLRRIVPLPESFDVPGPDRLPEDATAWAFCVQVAPDPGTDDPPRITNYTPDQQVLCSDPAELPPDAVAS